MFKKDFFKFIGISLLISFVLYAGSGPGNVTPYMFLFFFLVFVYLGSDHLKKILTEENESTILNKNFTFAIVLALYLAGAHLATGIVVSEFIDYCNGFFKDEMMCEIEKAESGISDKYKSGDYSEHDRDLR